MAKEEIGDHNKNIYFENTSTMLQTERNSKITVTESLDFESIEVSVIEGYLTTKNIFIECSHGSRMSFRINGCNTDAPFENDCIYAGRMQVLDLSNIEFLLLMSCNCGLGYIEGETNATSMVSGAILGGAKTVIGFSSSINLNDVAMFVKYLLDECINDDKTIQEAVENFSINCTGHDPKGNSYNDNNFGDYIVLAGNGNYKF